VTVSSNEKSESRLSKVQSGALVSGLLGLAVCFVGYFIDKNRVLQSYLFSFVFFWNLSLGCLGLLMLHHMTSGKWGFAIQRYLEAGTRTIPVMALFFLPILFGMQGLYPWMQIDKVAETVVKKSAYLNEPFFIIRAVAYFVLWTAMAYFLTHWSRKQDNTKDPKFTKIMRRLSAPGLALYALTVTFASIDWVMSLEPEWYSSIYGMMFMVSQALGALCLSIVLLRVFSTSQPVSDIISPSIFHDLGNLLLAMVILWAYMAFSQFLITWSGNLPEEIPWYLRRLGSEWQFVALGLIILHFFVPFFILLLRRSKRAPSILWKIAAGLLLVRIVDTYWMIEPAFHPQEVMIHWFDLAALVAIGGFWVFSGLALLKGASLVPAYDPRFAIVNKTVGAAHG